jgi:hypothetical protein
MRATMRWRAIMRALMSGNSITSSRRLGSSDHRRDTSRHAGGTSNPAIDARHDPVGLPARRCGFHGHRRGTSILSVRASALRSMIRKSADASGSLAMTGAMCGGRVACSSSRSSRSTAF